MKSKAFLFFFFLVTAAAFNTSFAQDVEVADERVDKLEQQLAEEKAKATSVTNDRNEDNLKELKRARKEAKRRRKAAASISSDAKRSAKEAKKAYKAEKRAQKARRDAEKHARKAKRAKARSDSNR